MPKPKKERKNDKQGQAGEVDKSGRIYRPPAWAYRYLSACLDIEIKPTISGRCEAAGISRQTFYDARRDERFVRWLNAELSREMAADHREVRSSLLRLCVQGNLEAIKLWHQLDGDFIPTERRILDGDLSGVPDRTLDEVYRILETGRQEGKGAKIN